MRCLKMWKIQKIIVTLMQGRQCKVRHPYLGNNSYQHPVKTAGISANWQRWPGFPIVSNGKFNKGWNIKGETKNMLHWNSRSIGGGTDRETILAADISLGASGRETVPLLTTDMGKKTVSIPAHSFTFPQRTNSGYVLSISPLRYSRS